MYEIEIKHRYDMNLDYHLIFPNPTDNDVSYNRVSLYSNSFTYKLLDYCTVSTYHDYTSFVTSELNGVPRSAWGYDSYTYPKLIFDYEGVRIKYYSRVDSHYLNHIHNIVEDNNYKIPKPKGIYSTRIKSFTDSVRNPINSTIQLNKQIVSKLKEAYNANVAVWMNCKRLYRYSKPGEFDIFKILFNRIYHSSDFIPNILCFNGEFEDVYINLVAEFLEFIELQHPEIVFIDIYNSPKCKTIDMIHDFNKRRLNDIPDDFDLNATMSHKSYLLKLKNDNFYDIVYNDLD